MQREPSNTDRSADGAALLRQVPETLGGVT
jgi:hypothetical protein